MEVLRANAEVRERVRNSRREGKRIGLVPTMGYLHQGHRELIKRARQENDGVAVSIFVNPTQFGPNEDFERYPRNESGDFQICEAEGVDWIYAPGVDELYPNGQPGTLVQPPGELSSSLCGSFRPGHFTGVATVVTKLFSLWQPCRAYFGLKDFQQTAVLRRMTSDLCLEVDIILVPTVREADGLALSSRNVYLSPEERNLALAIPRALQAGWEQAKIKEAHPRSVLERAERELTGLHVQYLSLVDRDTLAPATDLSKPAVLAIAAYCGKTRLIDNVLLDGPAPLAQSFVKMGE